MSLFQIVLLWIAASAALTPLVGGVMFVGSGARDSDIDAR
jgi:hypothetical protein